MFARLIDFLLCRFASFITGVRPQAAIAEQSSEGHRVYFACDRASLFSHFIR